MAKPYRLTCGFGLRVKVIFWSMPTKDESIRPETANLLRAYKRERRNLIPILQKVQQVFGYLPRESMSEIAVFLDIPEVKVYGVASFYNQFRFVPPADHPIKVCMGTACHIKGGQQIVEAWERELQIKVGETTPDLKFSLDRVACVGCCTLAPVTVVEENVHGKVTPTKIKGILLPFDGRNKEGDEKSDSE